MAHSLNKGRRAEREVIAAMQPVLDYVWKDLYHRTPPKLERRGLGVSGEDISGLEWLSIEVKHREQLQVDTWWEQAVRQSRRRNGGKVPAVLIYKRNHVPWRVRTHGAVGNGTSALPCTVDINMDTFLLWFYELAKLACEYEIALESL